MAERVQLKQVTIPAGTLSNAPLSTVLTWLPGVVRSVQIIVPPGPRGLMGFRIAHSGQIIIPFSDDLWVVTDDEKLTWELSGYPTGAKWTFIGYNAGQYDHTVYMRWMIDEIPDRAPGLTPINFG